MSIFYPGPPRDVMVSNMVYGIEQANVTIEWTPPTNGRNVMYTIGTTPATLSGAIPDTDSTHINITVNYNTNYMVTVAIITTCAVEATTTFIIGELVLALHYAVCENNTFSSWLFMSFSACQWNDLLFNCH